jgi:iron complex outermembrane receptor protein
MKRIQLFLAVLLSFFIFSGSFAADVAEITGKVTDAKSQSGLAGATISIPDLRISAITDSNGEFTLKNLPASGRFLVQVSYVGYRSLTQVIDFARPGILSFNLQASVN